MNIDPISLSHFLIAHRAELMVLAQLDPLVNLWSSVFDFTPMGGNQQETPNTNWRLLPTDDQVQDRFNEAELVHCARFLFFFLI